MDAQQLRQGAQRAQQALRDTFWDPRDGIFRHRIPLCQEEPFVYWWHAHAIDALLDAHLRTGEAAPLTLAKQELAGVMAKNGGQLLHNWYDDMEWMALALLRMWRIDGLEETKNQVYALWRDIQTAWNEHMGGGLAWRKDQLDYKNTPANAPAAILALRLHRYFGDEEALAWGRRIFCWNRDNLMDLSTGYVWDGMNRLGDGKIDYDWAFTYCQGTMIGAAVELYRITGEREHLTLALRIAQESQRRFCTLPGGVMPKEGEDDCGLFRGIFFRYLVELIREVPDQDFLRHMILDNARAVLTQGMGQTGIIGAHWTQQPGQRVDLAQHHSGIMLLEMAILEQDIP